MTAPNHAQSAQLALIIDRACDKFETAWKAAGPAGKKRPVIEKYLGPLQGPARTALLTELLAIDVAYRRRLRESPTIAEYRARFPELGGGIASLVDDEGTLDPSDAPAPPASAGPAIPGYEILDVLGRGGMGVVYRARHQKLKRVVALKMILGAEDAGSDSLVRFRREAEAVARLQHPHIVQLYEFGEHAGKPYFTLEYVDGGSIDKRLNGAPIAPRLAAALARTLAVTMHFAHEHGVIHRDLKPANILLTSNGLLKITDFGLAREIDQDSPAHTQTGAILGTPSYMAPEQALGSKTLGPTADIYALGAILYEMLTGRPPFRGATPFDTIRMVVGEEPVPPTRLQAKCPRDLETICLKCLAKEPRRRYASAGALAEDLQRYLNGEPIRARAVSAWERLAKWAWRRPTSAALVLLLTLVGLALVVGGLWFGQHEYKQRVLAESLRKEAQEKAESEERLRLDAQRLNAKLARERGQNLCAAGEPGAGLLWLVHSLELSPDPPGEADRAVRTHIDAARLACHPLEVQFEHPGGLGTAVLSSDGKRIATALGNEVRLWDMEGKPVGEPLVHEKAVAALAFSPDGKTLATGGFEQVVRFWDAETGKPRDRPIEARRRISALTYSPDRRTLAVGIVTTVEMGMVELYDLRSGNKTKELASGRPWALSFNRDGDLLAAAEFGFDVAVWEMPGGKALSKLHHNSGILTVAFAPSGRTLLTGNEEEATLWRWEGELAGGRYVAGSPMRHRGRVSAAAFSPDGSTCLTGGHDGTARLWRTRTERPLGAPIPHGMPVKAVAYTPDGSKVMTATIDGVVRLWGAGEGQLLWGQARERQGRDVAVSPDDRLCVSAHRAGVGVWDAKTGRLHAWLPHPPGFVQRIAVSPDGKLVASSGSDGSVRLWNMDTMKQVGEFTTESLVELLDFSPDGKILLARNHGSTAVRRWQVPGIKELQPPLSQKKAITEIAISPSPGGRLVLTVANDRTSQLWDATSGEPEGKVMAHDAALLAVAFSADGQTIAASCTDEMVYLWETATQERRATPPIHHPGKARRVCFSPDGKSLLTCGSDRTARVWDAATGKPLHTMEHGSVVSVSLFSPDGRLILTGSSDGTARLWDAATGLPVTPPLVHHAPVLCGAFSRDGERIYVGVQEVEGGKGDGVRCWAVPRPAEGDVERLKAEAEALTGMRLGTDDVVRPLDRAAWEQRRTERERKP